MGINGIRAGVVGYGTGHSSANYISLGIGPGIVDWLLLGPSTGKEQPRELLESLYRVAHPLWELESAAREYALFFAQNKLLPRHLRHISHNPIFFLMSITGLYSGSKCQCQCQSTFDFATANNGLSDYALCFKINIIF